MGGRMKPRTQPSAESVADTLMVLYAVWYFQPDKTAEQFAAMDEAAMMISKFPGIGWSIEDIRKRYPPK